MDKMRFNAAVVCLLSLSALHLCQGATWDYAGVNNWPTDFPGLCDGQRQSPIDLVTSDTKFDARLRADPFVFTRFDNTSGISWSVKNDGHTLVVNYGDSTEEVLVSGGMLPSTYKVRQFHFHWGPDNTQGSEHTVDGTPYPLEVHIVTFNTKYSSIGASLAHADGLAVLGFFFEISPNVNPTMQTLVDIIPSITTAKTSTSNVTPFALDNLIAGTKDFYRYSGGLTTPPCAEVVTWTVFKETIKISAVQLKAFRTLQDVLNNTITTNVRPVQGIYARPVTSTLNTSSAPGLFFSILLVTASLVLSLQLRA